MSVARCARDVRAMRARCERDASFSRCLVCAARARCVRRSQSEQMPPSERAMMLTRPKIEAMVLAVDCGSAKNS